MAYSRARTKRRSRRRSRRRTRRSRSRRRAKSYMQYAPTGKPRFHKYGYYGSLTHTKATKLRSQPYRERKVPTMRQLKRLVRVANTWDVTSKKDSKTLRDLSKLLSKTIISKRKKSKKKSKKRVSNTWGD